MEPMFLTRAELRRDVPASALRKLLLPDGAAARAVTSHHLVWTLFADTPDRTRDFLWREHSAGVFYCLSARPPRDLHGLFSVMPPKEFAPALSPDDHLAFDLRVNATVSRGGKPGFRGTRSDIVMDAIHSAATETRADARREVMHRVASEWMRSRGVAAGVELAQLTVGGYSVLQMARGRGVAPARIGVLDLRGTLLVRDAPVFLAALRHGFGRGKAFGCGLMLIRRA